MTRTSQRNTRVNAFSPWTNTLLLSIALCLCLMHSRYLQPSLRLHPLSAGDTLPHCPSLPPFPTLAHGLSMLHPTQPTILRTSSAPLSMVPILISHAPVIMVSPTLLNKPLVLDMIVHILAENPPLSMILGRESVPCTHTSWC